MKYNKWELWWAYVKYEDSDEIKRRPVLIIDDKTAYILAYKITSHEPRHDMLEYEIIRWVSAGLSEESTVRLSRIIELNPDDMDKKIGELHLLDVLRISQLID